jgi:hypothetical protein
MFLLVAGNLSARSAADYLPDDMQADPAVPTPEAWLGWEIGDRHVGHDALVGYLYALAESSPRVTVRETGRSHEKRPLLQLAVTSPENQGRLEALRQAHLAGEGPLVVWMGYSVHGDEPSGSNASMLAAYYLAASRSPAVEELLAGTIVLIDPAINPDGLDRFASWANQNAARNPVGDPVTRQHRQPWPGARTNHYWFDLNRDWLPLVQPESRVRIAEYHRWLPHVLTDHHEQGGRNPGFFFQPGVPSRQNPLTPAENFELTRLLADFHATAMDAAGQLYFTEDSYDDFYFGKGSTYPDINGGVGILFEQRAIRGQALDTVNGTETFAQAIANQLRVSLSTLRGAWQLRDRLKSYQAGFHERMQKRAASRRFTAWVLGDDGDPERARALLEVLALHQIEYAALGETVRAGSHEFRPGSAWVIPAQQRQFGLLEAIMEQRTEFEDNTFYDVSAWTLPLAWDLPYATVSRMPDTTEPPAASSGLAPDPGARAWLIPWGQLGAPALLQDLLEAGARVRAARKPFSAGSGSAPTAFQRGTLLVHAGIQDEDRLEGILERLSEAALNGLQITSIDSSMTPIGPDFGASHFTHIGPVKPLILGGKGVSSYDAGATWHLLDERLGIAVPLVEQRDFDILDLDQYTHILLPDGHYRDLDETNSRRIARWVKDGGILVASGRAADWAERLCFGKQCEEEEQSTVEEPAPSRAYSDFSDDRARLVIGGAIAAAIADLSHPLCYGIQRPELPVFRQGTVLLKPGDDAYSTPVRYSNEPLLAGFIGEQRLDEMRGQPAVAADRHGKGLVVRFANTPLFRGFWRGTERLYVNALYMGQTVQDTTLPDVTAPARNEPERL